MLPTADGSGNGSGYACGNVPVTHFRALEDTPPAEGHGAAQGHDAPEIEAANVQAAEVGQEAPAGGAPTGVASEIPE